MGRGIELGQANSATSRYKESEDYNNSPNKQSTRINTFGDELHIALKSPNTANVPID